MQTPLEIRYLIAAVFLAEDLSFTRAAKRIEMSQSGLMKEILCTNVNCGLKIKHSISAIERMFEFLPESGTAFQQIPYVCPMCKHLEIADVPSNPVKADPDGQPLTSGKCEYLVAIECDGKDCLHQIRAFATMERNIEIFDVEEQMREWSDGGATCVLDHHPRYPFVLNAVMDLASI